MVDYSKWDKFEDSDDERIAEDLRRVSKQPETLAQRQEARESAKRIARAFMAQEDETTGPQAEDDPANLDVAKRRNDAWCRWVADHKDANDAAQAQTIEALRAAMEKEVEALGGAEVVLDVERRIACVDATSQGVADVRCGPVDAAATYVVHVICDHSLISVIVANTTAITAVARPDEAASTDVRLSGALVSADIYALAAAS